MVLHNLLNVLVQIANKMGLQKKSKTKICPRLKNEMSSMATLTHRTEW
jgi:hypothetical protein